MSTLCEFVRANRQTIIDRAEQRVKGRMPKRQADAKLEFGVPLFLDQLGHALSTPANGAGAPAAIASSAKEITHGAAIHGAELLKNGFTLEQVVHAYGDVCQVVTELAVQEQTQIGAADFQVFNGCLDDAIAGAVTEYGNQRERDLTFAGIERHGVLAHELRNLLHMATLSFDALRTGSVGVGGSTGALHARSLSELNVLVERALAEVRLEANLPKIERVLVADFIEESGIKAKMMATAQRITLTVGPVAPDLVVEIDRMVLGAALLNLLQNAIKFTTEGGNVSLLVRSTADRVQLDVCDECGGLPPGRAEALFLPFTQESSDRSGLGLGLSIALSAVRASSGTLSVRDMPGKGCVFTIDLPLQT